MRTTSSSFLRHLLRAGLLLALPLATSGCLDLAVAMMIHEASSPNACQEASERIVECFDFESVNPDAEAPECSGQAECTADCVNEADCVTLVDAFSGAPSSRSAPFMSCLSSCSQGEKPL